MEYITKLKKAASRKSTSKFEYIDAVMMATSYHSSQNNINLSALRVTRTLTEDINDQNLLAYLRLDLSEIYKQEADTYTSIVQIATYVILGLAQINAVRQEDYEFASYVQQNMTLVKDIPTLDSELEPATFIAFDAVDEFVKRYLNEKQDEA